MPDEGTSSAGLLSYQEVRQRIGTRPSYLLLGNGFSIACDPIFQYGSLYQAALDAGLSLRAQELFNRMGTNNFEGVMKLLEDAHWVAHMYGLVEASSSNMLADLETIKQTLVQAISQSHLDHPGEISEERKAIAVKFLRPYKGVFTTNYDLLLYWLTMNSAPPLFDDGFRSDPDDEDSDSLVFSFFSSDRPCMFHLHGALHLYLDQGQLRKHSSLRAGLRLTELVRVGLSQRQYPLFVAEGVAEKKREQIEQNVYLRLCLDKLRSINSDLVVFGHSLGGTDRHILQALATNRRLSRVYVGLKGDPDSQANLSVRATARLLHDQRAQLPGQAQELQVDFYASQTAMVWDVAS